MAYVRDGRAVHVEGLSDLVVDSPQTGSAGAALEALHEKAATDAPGTFVWVALFQPTKAELAAVRAVFDLDPHQVEDAANSRQRAKVDLDPLHAFAVLKTLTYRSETRQVESGQVAVFTGPTYVVTVRHGTTRELRELGDHLLASPPILGHGPIGVLHAVADLVVDGYLAVSDQVQAEVERLEEAVFSPRPGGLNSQLYLLKRENLEIRRAVTPLVAVAADLVHENLEDVPHGIRAGFRDVGEHVLRVADQSESVDSLLLALMAAANAQANLRQSEDQRRMAAWAALALVPTVVFSLYGMNFASMPELEQPWGYPLVLLLTGLVIVVLYRRFRSAGWL